MYESFYGLRVNPFSLTPDPKFLFMTDAHRDAAAMLTYAIMSRKGFTVLTGDAGAGKTTLLRSVLGSIPSSRACISVVLNPVLTPSEFFELTLEDFGISAGPSKAQRLTALQQFLLEAYAEKKVAVLVVDEAHRLSIDLLEEIRLLTNFETEQEKLLQIVLVGQDELGQLLDRFELRQLKQRINLRFNIRPLSAAEVPQYMRHRWLRASARDLPFTPEAMDEVARLSAGIPRLVNTICDNALLLGFAESSPWIQRRHILEIAQDLRLNSTSMEKLRLVPQTLAIKIPPPVSGTRNGNPAVKPGKDAHRLPWHARLGNRLGFRSTV